LFGPPLTHSEISSATTSSITTRISGPSTHLSDGDFVGVHENSNLIHISPSHDFTAEQGYIETPTGLLAVTAKVDEVLNDNLISQSFAISNSITINPLDPDEEALWVQVGNRKEKCLGKVTLQWTMGTRVWKLFPVHCWVCTHKNGVGDLVFGGGFVKKRDHYFRGREAESG
jgi:hypothetical protein